MTKTLVHVRRFERGRGLGRGLVLALGLAAAGAHDPAIAAGSFDFLGLDAKWSLSAAYAYAIRLEEPSDGVIDAPPRAEIPIPDEFKYPESNNFDDGDRNFDQYSAVNNRVTLLGDLEFRWNDFGIFLRGDAFYDRVYNKRNDNDAPDRLNTRQEPPDSFTSDAKHFSGQRMRLLDAYAFGSFNIFGRPLSLRVGQHVAAWGQSLFFSGVALAQSPADATKATVPGASVKSIILPTNQISARFALTDRISLLGQYKLEYKHSELNPTGEFFSIADIVGPGAEFAYGIKNPLFLDNLSDFDLGSNDVIEVLNLIGDILLGEGGINLPPIIPDELPPISLPATGQNPFDATDGINPERAEDILPDDGGQWGLGVEYMLNFTTTLGYYHLRYANPNPTVRMNFGYATLTGPDAIGGLLPQLTTEVLGLLVPVDYNVMYFDDITLNALSLSTVLFGINFGTELIYREGTDVLVDVYQPINGPVPTPTRADVAQVLVNGIYTTRPRWYWDSFTVVGEVGYIHVRDVEPRPNVDGEMFDKLTYDENAWAFAMQTIFTKNNIFKGWSLQVPISVQGAVQNHTAFAGGFGSLVGEDDYRLGIGLNFTRLGKLELGLTYNGFIGGDPDFDHRPLQDRDTLGFTAKYQF